MDPYATLGISRRANADELKKAYRKEAMRWHPDRAGNSAEAKERFQQICLAYRALSREIANGANADSPNSGIDKGNDKHDDVFTDVMLEYAVGLLRSGLSKQEVKRKLSNNGCDADMAGQIANKACRFQADFTETYNGKTNKTHQGSAIKQRKFGYRTIQAMLGQQNPDRKGRKSISDYHETFNRLYEKEQAGSIFSFSKNRTLSKIFNRSILLFLLIAVTVYYLPQLTRHIPFGLIDFFQLPNIVLSLMLVWSAYRKLWLFSLIGLSIFAITQLYYYYAMPSALEKDYTTIFLLSLLCYLPFVLIAYLANFFYYRKAKATIDAINVLYPNPDESEILIKNKGGRSRLSALLFAMALSLYFLHMIPQHGSLNSKISSFTANDTKTAHKDIEQNKARISESERLFTIAEEHFNRIPPDYQRARLAYRKAANYGSLLSSYKLGYMYFTGQGSVQNDEKALYYFNQAVASPLASQPHALSTATRWLSESYKSLGIMYLGGYGTIKNRYKAMEMFAQAVKYQPSNRMTNLMQANGREDRNLRSLVTPPEYGQ